MIELIINKNVSRETLLSHLNSHLSPLNKGLTVESSSKLYNFWEEVLRWNKTHNLTTITEFDAALDFHFLDSLYPVSEEKVFSSCSKILDLGTGAGFPGIPLSVVFPEISFFLIDKNHKKISFLQYVSATLKMDNVFPVNSSFFTHFNKYDAIISRAVKIDKNILLHCQKIINKNGWLIVYYSSNQAPVESLFLKYVQKYGLANNLRHIAFYQF